MRFHFDRSHVLDSIKDAGDNYVLRAVTGQEVTVPKNQVAFRTPKCREDSSTILVDFGPDDVVTSTAIIAGKDKRTLRHHLPWRH